VCEQTSGRNYTQIYITAGKEALSPHGNNKFWFIRAIQGLDKQVTDGLGKLCYYGNTSNGKDQGH
jgi:hypothetical protein